ncbi:HAMP domain-containing sensor histidine kinase [Thermoflavimicrobium dichotomicum]|uniref:histidine kinase n=1 Tax=Thermoflavimicrobium dichotomicum TaxID=46223 RepID=A0A1I3P2R9_9BACL|nr:HAMP domain-containing sensor histidine kinase [Thermoflavimicrobium dichotomicum]SFJ15838.1 HAMP domain-containing protein [Thermoflavimicrobium dichotomicum]
MLKPLFSKIGSIVHYLYEKFSSSLRWQFIGIILICTLIAALAGMIASNIAPTTYQRYYYPTKAELEMELKSLASIIQVSSSQMIHHHLNHFAQQEKKVRIITPNGLVIDRSNNTTESHMDLSQILVKIAHQDNFPTDLPEWKEIYALYPVEIHKKTHFLVASVQSSGALQTYQTGNPFYPFVVSPLSFILTYIFLTSKKLKQLKNVSEGMQEIANGHFHFRLPAKGQDEISVLAMHINQMAEKLEQNRAKEKRIERERTELITSLSHDLRTPLTSIIGYLKYLLDQPHLSKEEMRTYADIALAKSEKLKQMIDNLFEYTKLTHHEIKLNKELISVNELVNQLIEETFLLSELDELKVERNLTDEQLLINADPLLLVRMLENLFQNAVRYAKRPGKIIIVTAKNENTALIQISNSAEPIDLEVFRHLFDMFVTGDKVRSKHGSGIGLSIVKRIIELHQGTIQADQQEGFITFSIHFPLAK